MYLYFSNTEQTSKMQKKEWKQAEPGKISAMRNSLNTPVKKTNKIKPLLKREKTHLKHD